LIHHVPSLALVNSPQKLCSSKKQRIKRLALIKAVLKIHNHASPKKNNSKTEFSGI
jgi:hypothetical protein